MHLWSSGLGKSPLNFFTWVRVLPGVQNKENVMDILRFKIPLIVVLPRPVMKNQYSTYHINMDEINFNSISEKDIEQLDGQYDWIDAWRDNDYDRKMGGFNNKDVLMEVVYEKGNYIVTLISDKSFNTIVKNNHYYSSSGPWDEITLKEAVVRFIEGCISDGIGENEIGYITYQYERCDVWMGELIEI